MVEGAPIPVAPLTFAKRTVEPIKVSGIVAASKEILSVSRGNQWLFAELGRALVRGQNDATLAALTANATPTASTSAVADVKALLQAVNETGAAPILVLAPTTAAAAATIDNRMFRDLTPLGGFIAGVPAIVADTDLDSSGLPEVVAIDAARLITASEVPQQFATQAGTIQMLDDPAGGTGELVSLFQEDATAIRLSRRIGFELVRDGAVAVISGADW